MIKPLATTAAEGYVKQKQLEAKERIEKDEIGLNFVLDEQAEARKFQQAIDKIAKKVGATKVN